MIAIVNCHRHRLCNKDSGNSEMLEPREELILRFPDFHCLIERRRIWNETKLHEPSLISLTLVLWIIYIFWMRTVISAIPSFYNISTDIMHTMTSRMQRISDLHNLQGIIPMKSLPKKWHWRVHILFFYKQPHFLAEPGKLTTMCLKYKQFQPESAYKLPTYKK